MLSVVKRNVVMLSDMVLLLKLDSGFHFHQASVFVMSQIELLKIIAVFCQV